MIREPEAFVVVHGAAMPWWLIKAIREEWVRAPEAEVNAWGYLLVDTPEGVAKAKPGDVIVATFIEDRGFVLDVQHR